VRGDRVIRDAAPPSNTLDERSRFLFRFRSLLVESFRVLARPSLALSTFRFIRSSGLVVVVVVVVVVALISVDLCPLPPLLLSALSRVKSIGSNDYRLCRRRIQPFFGSDRADEESGNDEEFAASMKARARARARVRMNLWES